MCPGHARQRAPDGAVQMPTAHLWLWCVPAGQRSEMQLSAADLWKLLGERGSNSRPHPNAGSCQARSSDAQLSPPVRLLPGLGEGLCTLFCYFRGGQDKKLSQRGSDLPKVSWQGCVSAKAGPPLTPVLWLCVDVSYTWGWYGHKDHRVHAAARFPLPPW